MGLTNRWPSQTNTDIETEGYLLGIILYAHSQQNWNQIQRSHARKIAVIMKQIHLLAVSLTPDYRYESAMYNTQYHNSSVMKENCITGILTCCTSTCKYRFAFLQSILNYNCSIFLCFNCIFFTSIHFKRIFSLKALICLPLEFH